jgi:purine-cytosine permease-like protein
VIIGGLLATLKLSLAQALCVTLAGYLLFALVGYGGVPGARAGTATLVISRAAVGRRGHFVPALLSWFTVVGWEAVNIVLGAFALYSLLELFGLTLGTAGKAIVLAIRPDGPDRRVQAVAGALALRSLCDSRYRRLDYQ